MSNLDPNVFSDFKDSLVTVITQTQSSAPQEKPATVVGTDSEGTIWVRMLGSDNDTPVAYSATTVSEGDSVDVLISNGSAKIKGNRTSPSAGVAYVDNGIKNVKTQSEAYFNVLRAEKADFSELHAAKADIDDLYATKATVIDLEATNAEIENLDASKANITDLNATNATVQNLSADYAQFKTATVDDLAAKQAAIGTLNANKANVTDLTATNGNITALVSKLAGFDTAVADFLAAEHLEVDLADIDVATVTEGWIKDLMVQGEIIAQSGQLYYLDSVHINAQSIDAGTLNVDRLLINAPQPDGSVKKYLLQVNQDGTTTNVEVASTINDRTLTATKLIANSITTDEITVNNLAGTGGWINLANGTFKYMNVHTHEDDDDNWDDSSNGISWDGSTLQIKSDDIELTSGEKITGIVTDLRTAEGEVTLLRSDVDQTAAGLSVTVTDLHAVQDYIGSPDDTNGLLHRLNEQVFATIPVYMNFTSDNGSPLLTIGGGDKWGQFKMAITNTGLDIINEATQDRPAYFTKDGLFIQQAEVVGDLYFGTGDNGGWQWTVRENGHMTLRKVR